MRKALPNVQFARHRARPYVSKEWPSKVRAEQIDISRGVFLRVWSEKRKGLVLVEGTVYALIDLTSDQPDVFEVLGEKFFLPLYIYEQASSCYVRRAVYAMRVTAHMLKNTTGKFVQTIGDRVDERTLMVGDWLVQESETYVAVYRDDVFKLRFTREVEV